MESGEGEGPQRRKRKKPDGDGAWWDQDQLTEEAFKKEFRMGRLTFNMICEELSAQVAAPVRQKIAACIWRLATGNSIMTASVKFVLAYTTCRRYFREVFKAVDTLLVPKYLQWPDEDVLSEIKDEFESTSGIPDVLGSMLTSPFPVTAPKFFPGAYVDERLSERNQKTSYSMLLQAIVNPRGVFTYVSVGWPGSMTGNEVLEKSGLFRVADEGLLTGMIVGSSGHSMMDCLLVPYTEQPLTRSQHAFNERIGKIQKAAKDGFARLKGRWAVLQKQIDGDEKEWNYL